MTFQPSPYQQAIFDWIRTGRGDGIINAVAGSGKTTTLIEAARLITSRSAIFVAFNKSIAEELGNRLKGTPVQAKTMHSVGLSCLYKVLEGKPQIEEKKYGKLTTQYVDEHYMTTDPETRRTFATCLKKLANMARLTLTSPTDADALRDMCEHYSIEVPEKTLLGHVAPVLKAGNELAKKTNLIDFTDMVYLPWEWGLQPPQSEWVFVDESQDLNRAQLELVMKMRNPHGGRMLFVGDPRQSIYGFAGADNRSFHNIKVRTGATELALSICYRCPSGHLRLAREIVPQIEARPNAPDGDINHNIEHELPSLVQEGDLVLCRLTAPLVSACIKMIRQRIPARVRGRDIAKDLIATLDEVAKMKNFDFANIAVFLLLYREQKMHWLVQREASETEKENLIDKVECLLTCAEAFEVSSIYSLKGEIEALFSDERSSVWLSTIHRAKGLEADRIHIMRPHKMPLMWKGQQDWEYEQEMNLRYVALTRAKRVLCFIHEDEGQMLQTTGLRRAA